MGQIILQESIGALSKISGTVVGLAKSVINLGGQQYRPEDIQCNLGVTGLGGLDTGSVEANRQKYNLYYCYLAGTKGLIATKASAPSGVTLYKRVGFLLTDGAGLIDVVYRYEDVEKDSENIFINGELRFSQRGDYTSLTAYNDNSYYLDRVKVFIGTISGSLQHKSIDQPSDLKTSKSLLLQATSTATSYMLVAQYIEDKVYEKLVGRIVTFSAYVKTSKVGKVWISMNDEGATDHYGMVHSGSGNWERMSMTFKVKDVPTLLMGAIRFSNGLAGGLVDITSGDSIEVTGMKLEIGAEATDYVSRSYEEELQKCERYYEILKLTPKLALSCVSGGSSWAEVTIPHRTIKRAAPSVKMDNAGAPSSWRYIETDGSIQISTGWTGLTSSITHSKLQLTGASYTTGQGGLFYWEGGVTTNFIALDAEV